MEMPAPQLPTQDPILQTHLNPQVMFLWKAPMRPFKKRAKNVLRFYIALALLLSLIIFFFGDKVLLVPIWALLFLFYVLTITPPPEVENKLTQFGIETAGMTIRWESLSHFYFTKRFGFDILTVVSHAPYYFHSYLVIPNEEIRKKVFQIVTKYLIFQEKPQRNLTDRLIDLLYRLIPDDEEETPPAAAVSSPTTPVSFPQTQGSASL
jgi:hypothetical protein